MKRTNKVLIVVIVIPLAFFSLIALGLSDADADEIIDLYDNCPNQANPNQENFDGDSLGDICDIDDDNDGIVDGMDAFALNTEEWDDFDFDGIGANEDTDDDNDGILDVDDPLPSPISSRLTTKYIDLVENCAVMDPGSPRQVCYRDFFVSLVDEGERSAEIINMVFFYAKLDIIDSCHPIAHHIGHYSFVKNPNLSENILQGQHICRDGFYHGVLAAYFGNLKTEEVEISNSYKVVCDEFVDTEHFTYCIHGLGHGLVVYYDNDLMTAVDACNDLSDDLSFGCMNGVMMEYTDHKLTEAFDGTKDIPDICSIEELTLFDRVICYKKMGQLLGFLTNHDFEKSNEYCAFIDADFYDLCLDGVVGEIVNDDNQKTLHMPFN